MTEGCNAPDLPSPALVTRLAALAEEIKTSAARLDLIAYEALEEYRATGEKLAEAKALVETMQSQGVSVTWTGWLREHCPFSSSHAYRMIDVYTYWLWIRPLSTPTVGKTTIGFREVEKIIQEVKHGETPSSIYNPAPAWEVLDGKDHEDFDYPDESAPVPADPLAAEAIRAVERMLIPSCGVTSERGIRSLVHRVVAWAWWRDPCMLSEDGQPVSQRELAERFGLSHNAISKIAKEFERSLGIKGEGQR